MLISEQLREAMGSTDVPRLDDTFRSLDGLVRSNDGLWKSDRQARFLLNRITGPAYRNRAAEDWARKQGYRGHVIANIALDERYGRRDLSKVRYYGNVYVIDDGGVVMRGKLKINHAKSERGQYEFDVDWGATKLEFERKKNPTIVVDVEGERKAAVKKNQPDIELIKTIPGWESRDILVDFIRQLENGHPLSLGQRGVVQRMIPEKAIFLGQKEEWKKTWDRYAKLIGDVVVPALRDYHMEQEREFEQKYQRFRKEKGESAYWPWRTPDVEGTEKKFKEYKLASSGASWIDRETVNVLEKGIGVVNLAAVSGSPNYTMERNVLAAIKRNKPSKEALRQIDWLTRVVEKFGDATKDQMLALIRKQESKDVEFETHKGRIFMKQKK